MGRTTDSTLPLVTIVTVTLNPGPRLERCVQSVRTQRFERNLMEHLVVDGGSTDGTVERLRAWQQEGVIDGSVSEPDQGLYDAMNKGWRLARGAFVAFLNADDRYDSDTLGAAMAAAQSHQADYVYGAAHCASEDGRWQFVFQPTPDTLLVGVPFCHQTLFCRRTILEACGGFNLACGLAADQDLILKLLEHHAVGVRYPGVGVHYCLGGASSNSVRQWRDLYGVHAAHATLLRAMAEKFGTAAETYLNLTTSRLLALSRREPGDARQAAIEAIDASLRHLQPWTWRRLRGDGRAAARLLAGVAARLAAGRTVTPGEALSVRGVIRVRWWLHRTLTMRHPADGLNWNAAS